MPSYDISLPDPAKARGNDPDLSFHAQGAAGLAEERPAHHGAVRPLARQAGRSRRR